MKNNLDYEPLAIGYKLGQGVSSLNRILVSLTLYEGSNNEKEDAIIKKLINEIQEVIKKISI
jgi:hypothetical protein